MELPYHGHRLSEQQRETTPPPGTFLENSRRTRARVRSRCGGGVP